MKYPITHEISFNTWNINLRVKYPITREISNHAWNILSHMKYHITWIYHKYTEVNDCLTKTLANAFQLVMTTSSPRIDYPAIQGQTKVAQGLRQRKYHQNIDPSATGSPSFLALLHNNNLVNGRLTCLFWQTKWTTVSSICEVELNSSLISSSIPVMTSED